MTSRPARRPAHGPAHGPAHRALLRSRPARTGLSAVSLVLGASLLSGGGLTEGLVGAVTGPGVSTVAYQASDAVVPNPERGFYHAADTHYYAADESGYVPLDVDVLRGYRAQGITLVYRGFYLERFVDGTPLTPEYLALVQADFDTARAAGVSLVPRFAYKEGGDFPYDPPYGDAPVDVALADIHQLGPLLRENSDVITTLQAGFIGLWGEWYYSDYFSADPADPGTLTAADWANRRKVVAALLRELPKDRTIQVRTPAIKQNVLGVPTGTKGALTAEEGYSESDKARIGHHNDCLLASPDDFGTFLSDPLSLDQDYLAQDSAYVPVGGETCAVNPPRSELASATAEFAKYHYSFLNTDYNQDVLGSWGADGVEQVAKHLGYRFVLVQSRVRSTGKFPGVSVTMRNDGWSAPFNPRPARLVLSGQGGTWAVDPGVDTRALRPGATGTMAVGVCGVPKGTYSLHLEMPSADASVAGNPDYSIQTANTGTWEEKTGRNDLGQTLTVARATKGCKTPAERLDG